MAEKTTTLAQMQRLANKIKMDSTARIAEISALVAAGLEDVQHDGITITLPAANWNNRTQTVTSSFFLADQNDWYFVCGDADCFMECSDTGIRADNITVNGQATFRCEITPEMDLTVNILRLEVET